uniref:Serine/threonine/tyrosine kinase 1b n=1 Tax=Amphiprion percula TaxID=161767 RepID=A0A3P8SSD4_AMPPE
RMSSLSEADFRCQHGDTICEIRVYEQEVIVVPIFLLSSFLFTLVFIFLLRFCPEKVDRIRPNASKSTPRRVLQGIDAPPGINVLDHESIALEALNSYSTFHPPNTYQSKRLELPRQRLPESFNLVSPLPAAFSLKSDSSVSLYRARMENRNVVLRVLNDSADASERHSFLGFASFLTQLGPHPFLPELLGVVSLRAPLVTVVEELENRDLLSFLWRCRRVDPPAEMTERRIFTMAQQVASALEFLHGKDLLHGNLRAHSVLVSQGFTAKLWGLHGVYSRRNQDSTQREDPSMKKWQAPELLVRKPASHSMYMINFSIFFFKFLSPGEAPFAEISVNELLQFHQRGKTLKKPPNCSNALNTIIKGCCQWKDQDRPTLAEVSRKLASGEKSASDKVLKAGGPVNIEQYLQEAGYGETNSYTIF